MDKSAALQSVFHPASLATHTGRWGEGALISQTNRRGGGGDCRRCQGHLCLVLVQNTKNMHGLEHLVDANVDLDVCHVTWCPQHQSSGKTNIVYFYLFIYFGQYSSFQIIRFYVQDCTLTAQNKIASIYQNNNKY